MGDIALMSLAEGPALAGSGSCTARSDMAAVTVREGYLDLSHRIEVTDQAGELILDLHFRNAVRIKQ